MDQPPSTPGRSAARLAEQLVELSALTGGLAHEIRNPLSTLQVNLQLLDEDWRRVEQTADDGAHAADVARRSRTRIAALLAETQRLEQILADFLQFVGKRDLQLRRHDLNVVIREMADFYRPQAEAGGVRLVLEPCQEPLHACVDATYLKQALLNLLINAQQAMPHGGAIVFRLAREGPTHARVDVIDNGPGVPPEMQERVFEAYYSTKPGGTGLGLATTRQIIREHGGTVEVHSTPPAGSRFAIVLPLAP